MSDHVEVIERIAATSVELAEAVGRLCVQLTAAPVPDREAIGRVLDGGAHMVVARVDGTIVGMGFVIIATALTGTTAHVEDVVVDADARGRGIGERLMLELIEAARSEDADEMTLTSRPSREAANRLYRRLDFRLGGTNYYSLDLG